MSTFTALETEALYCLGSRSDLTAGGTRFQLWFDWAYYHIGAAMDFHELEVLSTDTISSEDTNYLGSTEGLPSDIWAIRALRDVTNAKVLTVSSLEELAGLDRTSTSGTPSLYLRFGTQLLLDKTLDTDTSYDLWYKKRPAQCTGTTELIYPKEWHEVVFLSALWKANRSLKNYPEATIYKSDLAGLLQTLVSQQEWEAIKNSEFGIEVGL